MVAAFSVITVRDDPICEFATYTESPVPPSSTAVEVCLVPR